MKLAEAYGIRAANLDSYDEIDKFRGWLRDSEPCLININLPEDTLLLPKMNWNQKDMLPLPPDDVINTVKSILS